MKFLKLPAPVDTRFSCSCTYIYTTRVQTISTVQQYVDTIVRGKPLLPFPGPPANQLQWHGRWHWCCCPPAPPCQELCSSDYCSTRPVITGVRPGHACSPPQMDGLVVSAFRKRKSWPIDGCQVSSLQTRQDRGRRPGTGLWRCSEPGRPLLLCSGAPPHQAIGRPCCCPALQREKGIAVAAARQEYGMEKGKVVIESPLCLARELPFRGSKFQHQNTVVPG